MELEGRVAFITGAASGIGKSTARTFAREGASVLVADINFEAARKVAAEIGEAAQPLALNVTSEADWQKAFSDVDKLHGRLDILVNCAGIGVAGNFEETTLADWQMVMDVNLTGVFLGCKNALALMRKMGTDASIVNISSIAGLVGGEDIAAYSASKGGVTMLTKSVALHCAQHAQNVRCNSVHPTYVNSEMLDPVAAQFPSREDMLKGMAELVPIGRIAEPQDIANMILFLSTEKARMISGAQMVVDGAQLAGLPARHSV